jgi:hypothetical protein
MNENQDCTQFLGICVAEKVCSEIFHNARRMPNNNPGYDIACNKNKRIDVKSSCIHIFSKTGMGWIFHINKNKTADCFLCIAFDNREDLNILHLWIIPGNVLNHLTGTSISVNTLDKWKKWEKPIDEAVCYCNEAKKKGRCEKQ